MKRWTGPLALLLGAVLCGLAPIWIIQRSARVLTARVVDLERKVLVEQDSLTTTWTDAKGRRQTVTTRRQAGESDDDLQTRHDLRVEKRIAKVGEQPPSPGDTGAELPPESSGG